MLEHHLGPGRPHSPRSQEVINPPQIPQDDMYMHVCECVCVCSGGEMVGVECGQPISKPLS